MLGSCAELVPVALYFLSRALVWPSGDSENNLLAFLFHDNPIRFGGQF